MGCCCHVLKQNKSQLWSSKQIGHLCQNVPTSTIGHRHLCKAALATAVVAPPGATARPAHTPPRAAARSSPPSECLAHDSDCGNCLGTMSDDPRWPGACLMLNVTLPSPNGLVNHHSCVPSSW